MASLDKNAKCVAESATLGQATREKYWDELTLEEKVERTRQQVKFIQNRLNELEDQAFRLERFVNEHQHVDGRLMVDAASLGSLRGGLIRLQDSVNRLSPDREYF